MKTMLYLFLTLVTFQVHAQEFEITGHVTDEATGEPVQMAYVYLSDLTTETLTDHNGYFFIRVPYADIRNDLYISRVGYHTFRITVKDIKRSFVSAELVSKAGKTLGLPLLGNPADHISPWLSKLEVYYPSQDEMLFEVYKALFQRDGELQVLKKAFDALFDPCISHRGTNLPH